MGFNSVWRYPLQPYSSKIAYIIDTKMNKDIEILNLPVLKTPTREKRIIGRIKANDVFNIQADRSFKSFFLLKNKTKISPAISGLIPDNKLWILVLAFK